MNRIIFLIVSILLTFSNLASAAYYNIQDDATGGQCTQIGTWDSASKTCSLTTDLYLGSSDTGIQIVNSGITLDGNGHILTGPGRDVNAWGVEAAWGSTGARIKNLIVRDYGVGIRAYKQATIESNWISNSGWSGISLGGFVLPAGEVNAFTVTGNTVDQSYIAVRSEYVTGSTFIANYFHADVETALQLLYGSSSNTINGNTLLSDRWGGLDIQGDNNVFHNNTIRGFCFNSGKNNSFYHNNFLDWQLLRIDEAFDNNMFSMAEPLGGNFWERYDAAHGCADSNSDGFCDSPYSYTSLYSSVILTDYSPWTMQNGWVDSDGDEYNKSLDCNDVNAQINPGALEIPYNGIDENCNGPADDDDVDMDGYQVASDCNDNDASIYPNAVEIKHDGIDQNCNGYDLTINVVSATYKPQTDLLGVEATSALGGSTSLQLNGYGTMTWNANKQSWTKQIRPAGGNPGTVTVAGIEGSETSPVVQ